MPDQISLIKLRQQAQATQEAGGGYYGPGYIKGLHSENIISVLGKRKWYILWSVFVFVALGHIFVWQHRPLYAATALIMLDTRKTEVVNLQQVMSGLQVGESTIRTELDILRSTSLAERVLDRLKLWDDPELTGAEDTYTLRAGLRQLIGTLVRSSKENEAVSDREATKTATISNFLSRLNVKNNGVSFTIDVTFLSSSPEKAAAVANTVVDQYLEGQLQAKYDATKRATLWLNERLAELREKVRASETALQEFKEQSELLEVSGSSVTAQQLSEVSSQLIDARATVAQSEAELRRIRNLISRGDAGSAPQVLASPVIQHFREQESELVRREAEFKGQYGERHPKVINLRAEIGGLQDKIDAEVSRIVSALESDVVAARSREQSLLQSLDKLQGQLGRLSRATVRLNELQREADANRALFQTFLSRFKETAEQGQLQQADATNLSRARPPLSPTYPRTVMILSITFVAGVSFGLALALLLEQTARRFRTIEEAETVLQQPVLGMVPRLSGRELRSLRKIVSDRTSTFYHAVHRLKTSLLVQSAGKQPRCVMVTSSELGEGKTTFAIAYATSLAKDGYKTLLFEGDFRRPSIAKYLNLASPQKLPSTRDELTDFIRTDEQLGGEHYAVP